MCLWDVVLSSNAFISVEIVDLDKTKCFQKKSQMCATKMER